MAGTTIRDLESKIDALALTGATQSQRIDALAAALREESSTVTHTFGEMRDFAAEGIGHLRADMAAGFAAVEVKFTRVDEKFDRADERFDRIDERFERIDERFDRTDERFDQIDKRFDRIEEQLGLALGSRRARVPRRRR